MTWRQSASEIMDHVFNQQSPHNAKKEQLILSTRNDAKKPTGWSDGKVPLQRLSLC